MEYLDAIDEEAQRELINDEKKEAFVYMYNTKWFNLQSREGRRMALCHILALLRWHDAEDVRRQAEDDPTEGNSDYPPEFEEESDQGRGDDCMDTEEY